MELFSDLYLEFTDDEFESIFDYQRGEGIKNFVK